MLALTGGVLIGLDQRVATGAQVAGDGFNSKRLDLPGGQSGAGGIAGSGEKGAARSAGFDQGAQGGAGGGCGVGALGGGGGGGIVYRVDDAGVTAGRGHLDGGSGMQQSGERFCAAEQAAGDEASQEGSGPVRGDRIERKPGHAAVPVVLVMDGLVPTRRRRWLSGIS